MTGESVRDESDHPEPCHLCGRPGWDCVFMGQLAHRACAVETFRPRQGCYQKPTRGFGVGARE